METSFFKKLENAISFIGAIIGIAGAIYGAIVYIDSRIEAKILSKIEPYQEFTTALAFNQTGFYYNAAHKLNKLYYKAKKEDETEILQPLVTALLESILESGYQEEFLHTIEQIQKDNLVPLQRRNLNDLGLIYLDLGQVDKAERALRTALTLVEASSPGAKSAEAITHWRLALVNMVRGDVNSASSCVLKACKLAPGSFKKSDFNFPTPEAVAVSYENDMHIERARKSNPQLDKIFYETSQQIQQ